MNYDDIIEMIDSRKEQVENLVRIANKVKGGKKFRVSSGGIGVKDLSFLEHQALLDGDIKDLFNQPVPARVVEMLLNVTNRSLAKFRDQGMPHGNNSYSVAACIQWMLKRHISKSGMTDSDREVDRRKKLASAIKTEVSATEVQMDLEERRGNLISKNDARAVEVAKIVRVRQAFSSLGKEISGKHGMGLVELGEHIDNRIREVCDAFAGFSRDDPKATQEIVDDIVEYCRFVVHASDNGSLKMGKFHVEKEEE